MGRSQEEYSWWRMRTLMDRTQPQFTTTATRTKLVERPWLRLLTMLPQPPRQAYRATSISSFEPANRHRAKWISEFAPPEPITNSEVRAFGKIQKRAAHGSRRGTAKCIQHRGAARLL